jgi:hypothetical protein
MAELDAFREQTKADFYAALQESPQAAHALLAERASTVVAELLAAARDSLGLEQRLRDQRADPADVETVRRGREQIMTAAGRILAIALTSDTPGNPEADT